jgi:hypothetical protein
MNSENTKPFLTYDLAQAAYLLCRGRPLRGLQGNGRKAFVFDASAQSDADNFYANAQVGALDFAAALRQVKARLYAG